MEVQTLDESKVKANREQRAETLFGQSRNAIYRRVDRLFAGLMLFQWVAGVNCRTGDFSPGLGRRE
jgi:hypothetical protein